MGHASADNVIVMPEQSNDWSKLIRKLRWIGMEEEGATASTSRAKSAAGPERHCFGRTVQHRLTW